MTSLAVSVALREAPFIHTYIHTYSFERVRRGHPPYAAIAAHFGLGRPASHAGACVSVDRAPCGRHTMHGLEHYAARKHALARAEPQFLCAASNE